MGKDLSINMNLAIKQVQQGIITKQEFLLRHPRNTEKDWYKFSKGHEFMIENYTEKHYFSVENIDEMLRGELKHE